MAVHSKAPQPTPAPVLTVGTPVPSEVVRPLDPKLKRVKELASKGDYHRALEMLAADSKDAEIRNCRAVCLMRLNQFQPAYDVLRGTVLHSGTQTARKEVADHIKINFATALFYGGLPSGTLDVLHDINREDDPAVKQLRESVRQWAAGLSFWRRLDWKLNQIAPKNPDQLPAPPETPAGRFVWELV